MLPVYSFNDFIHHIRILLWIKPKFIIIMLIKTIVYVETFSLIQNLRIGFRSQLNLFLALPPGRRLHVVSSDMSFFLLRKILKFTAGECSYFYYFKVILNWPKLEWPALCCQALVPFPCSDLKPVATDFTFRFLALLSHLSLEINKTIIESSTGYI